MLTIKWTQPSGAISIFESKRTCVLTPKSKAWDAHMSNDSDLKSDNMRAVVMHDGGTICVFIGEPHLYVVNENGKTVQTV